MNLRRCIVKLVLRELQNVSQGDNIFKKKYLGFRFQHLG